MNNRQLTATALRALRQHKTRSILTILGILIGSASIIVTFSIGRGAEEKIRKQMLSFGENSIYIIPTNIVSKDARQKSRLTEKDIFSLHGQLPGIKDLSRYHRTKQTMQYKVYECYEDIIGVDETFIDIEKNKVQKGQWFNPHHNHHRINTVVLGSKTAEKLFKNSDPVGKTIKIGNHPFVILGVMNTIEQYMGVNDPNLRAYIPFSVSKKYFSEKNETHETVGAIALSPCHADDVPAMIPIIRRTLRFLHAIPEDKPDDFTIFDQQTFSKAAAIASHIIKLLGIIAAFISLLVGGIGIMNIMLVSVQERTREIGVRMAFGATQKMIQLQFLYEATTLCMLGGAVGILLGITIAKSIDYFSSLPSIIELSPLIISFLLTVCIGIFFGFYPARKASQLHSVKALLNK